MTSHATPQTLRPIVHTQRGQETADGAGVRLTRLIGTPTLDQLDPFLLLDAFRSDDPDDYVAGFPDHPHRGFETVTYLLAGRMRHRDSTGREGVIEAGGVQWMTAGRGIIHSEMPQQENGLLFGFQLWVNLPAAHKMTAPRYQDLAPQAVPSERRDGGATLRVIAGTTSAGTAGPVRELLTPVLYLDVALAPGGHFHEPLPEDFAALFYLFEGSVRVAGGEREVPTGHLAVLGPGAAVELAAGGEGARLLLIAGRPLREPVARHGPFVMNTHEEIEQAFRDYRAGRLGG